MDRPFLLPNMVLKLPASCRVFQLLQRFLALGMNEKRRVLHFGVVLGVSIGEVHSTNSVAQF